jgi:RNA polymerase sigma-70 factor
MSLNSCFDQFIGDEFASGREHYGDVGLTPSEFVAYVSMIACKYLGVSPPDTAAIEFLKKLYMRDLYLVCGCDHENGRAWQVLDTSYRKFVTDLVRFCYRNGTDAEEVADSVLVSLYLHDRSGHHRISSYDGRSSLGTWLRVIVINRAINEKQSGRMVITGTIPDIPDDLALPNIELALRAGRYTHLLRDSLTCAFKELSARERLMLFWRYEENRQLGEIARLLGVHQSNVTRQLIKVQDRLRSHVTAILAAKHGLSDSAIQECLADMVENPQNTISLVNLIREAKVLSVVSIPQAEKRISRR